jgi:MoaA/NifB/PqqE/SkfB family radical SAM enzyme
MTLKRENNFTNDSFCPEVYNQIQIDMQGDLRICCLSSDSGMTRDANGQVMNVKTHSIIQAMNSDEHKLHRLELSNNIKPARCSNCYNWENHSASRRTKFIQYSNNHVLPDYVKAEDAYSITAADGSINTEKTKLLNLDIRFGNLCNLKCIMCDPGNSSLWYEDWDLLSRVFDNYEDSGRSKSFKQGGVDPVTGNSQYWKADNKVYLIEKNNHGKFKIEDEENWWETESWKNQFVEIAPQLQYIYFTGGEPLLVPAMQEHLDYLIEHGFSKNIRLAYDTNLTAINQHLIDKWKFFKHIELRISIDEVGDRYNIIRNPGNFNKLKENIKLVQDAGIPIQRLSMVCSIANIYGSIRVSQLAKELNVPLSFRFVNRPGWLNVLNLPISARQEVIDVLTNFMNSSEKESLSGYEYVVNAEIKFLKNTISKPCQQGVIKTFVKAMNALDQSRRLDWQTVLPDVADLLKRHCPEVDLNAT